MLSQRSMYYAGYVPRYHPALIVLILAALAVLSMLFACMAGSVPMSLQELAGALIQYLSGETGQSLLASILELRLQRALAAFVTGASLALAGVMMQALLRNPLADPYVLGVSGGASVGALLIMLFLGTAWMVNLAAFGGAIVITVLLYWLARRDLLGNIAMEGSSQLLLTGVILASGCGAFVIFILSIASDTSLRGMIFWMVGDLSGAAASGLPFVILGLALVFSLWQARPMNLLAQHAETAVTLGVPVAKLRKTLFICSALLTATAVTHAGSIGFIGLIIPHACRMAFGPDHRLLMPAAALTGGGFLILADTLARTVMTPHQLPVGVVTAFIGVPVFLVQLYRARRA